jgi:hypothetical protein
MHLWNTASVPQKVTIMEQGFKAPLSTRRRLFRWGNPHSIVHKCPLPSAPAAFFKNSRVTPSCTLQEDQFF